MDDSLIVEFGNARFVAAISCLQSFIVTVFILQLSRPICRVTCCTWWEGGDDDSHCRRSVMVMSGMQMT